MSSKVHGASKQVRNITDLSDSTLILLLLRRSNRLHQHSRHRSTIHRRQDRLTAHIFHARPRLIREAVRAGINITAIRSTAMRLLVAAEAHQQSSTRSLWLCEVRQAALSQDEFIEKHHRGV
jgi:hypothetical protein